MEALFSTFLSITTLLLSLSLFSLQAQSQPPSPDLRPPPPPPYSPPPLPSRPGSSSGGRSPPPPPPPPWHRRRHRGRRGAAPPPPPPREKVNVGKKVGVLFSGIAAILQIGVIAFLVFKRRQLLKVNNRYDSCS